MQTAFYEISLTKYHLSTAADGFVHNSKRRDPHVKATPVSIIVDNDDLMVVPLAGSTSTPVSTISISKYHTSKWEHNCLRDLLVHDKLAIVSQKRSVRKPNKEGIYKQTKMVFTTCFNWQTGQCLWVTCPHFQISWNIWSGPCKFLTQGTLLMASKKAFHVVSLATGKVLRTVQYQPFKRCFKELKNDFDRSEREEISIPGFEDRFQWTPWTGYSAGTGPWQIARLKNNKILVVHDMERFTPIVFDLLEMEAMEE